MRLCTSTHMYALHTFAGVYIHLCMHAHKHTHVPTHTVMNAYAPTCTDDTINIQYGSHLNHSLKIELA